MPPDAHLPKMEKPTGAGAYAPTVGETAITMQLEMKKPTGAGVYAPFVGETAVTMQLEMRKPTVAGANAPFVGETAVTMQSNTCTLPHNRGVRNRPGGDLPAENTLCTEQERHYL